MVALAAGVLVVALTGTSVAPNNAGVAGRVASPRPAVPARAGRSSPLRGAVHARAATASRTCAGTWVPPLMVVVGASFTAGAGASSVEESWAYQLGALMGWRVVVRAAPGVGFVNPGLADRGPIFKELAAAGLARLDPQLVVLQAGHDDAGYPTGAVSAGVRASLRAIEVAVPTARIVLISAFVRGVTPTSSMVATDRAIAAAARAEDPSAVVLSPLAQHWRFPTVADGLHPSPAGHRWIADRVAAALEQHGVSGRPLCPAA